MEVLNAEWEKGGFVVGGAALTLFETGLYHGETGLSKEKIEMEKSLEKLVESAKLTGRFEKIRIKV